MTTTPTPTERPPRRFSGRTLALGAAGVAVVAAAVFLIWFFNRDVPEEVSLEGAVAGLESTTTTVAGATGSTGASTSTTTGGGTTQPDSGGVDGVWSVDTSVGSFSFEQATSSFVGFRIAEELAGIGSTEAVGRTPQVAGTLEFDGTVLLSADITADLRGLVTNDSRRDNRVQSALETSQFPSAEFVLGEPIDIGSVPSEGVPLTVDAAGALTIHGVTLPIEIPLEAQLSGEFIVVVGSTTITMADFGVAVPSAPIVLSASDEAVLEIQLFFARS